MRRSRPAVGTARADKLYARVLNEYGDDSVAQLGSAHIACEGVSNILTKVLEWGRLMAYLEQSTRYVPYTDKPNGRWKYHVPAEIARGAAGRRIRAHDGFRVRDLRPLDSGDGIALPGEVSQGARRFRWRLPIGDSRQGARHAARTAPGGDHLQRRFVRNGTGVRSAAPADVRASARGSAGARAGDARGIAPRDSRVPRAAGSADPRRPLDSVSRRDATRGRRPGGARREQRRSGAAR